jgi:hypothetical protein
VGVLGPAPSLFYPVRDKILVGTSRDAEVSDGPGSRLVEAALVEAERQTRCLGQQGGPVVPAGEDLPELGHRGGRLRPGGFLPSRVTPGCPGQAGQDQADRVGAGTILRHLARVEHGSEKSKIAEGSV